MSDRKLAAEKVAYRERLLSLMKEYKKILVVGADNVGSNHFQRIRLDLRGDAVIYGKEHRRSQNLPIC